MGRMPVRRLVGALLVVAVVATALVIPALDGLRIAGRPAAIELPADPRVGDCVFAAAGNAGSEPDLTFATAMIPLPRSDQLHTPDAIGVAFGPCTGQLIVGEVVAIATAEDSQRAGVSTTVAGEGCRAQALRHAGLVPRDDDYALPDQVATDPVEWDVSINLPTTWVVPSAVLQSSGRTWTACVVTTKYMTEYRGRVAGAYSGGRLPDAFGTCWNSREVRVAARTVNCGDPHLAELTAVGTVADRATTGASNIRSSCERLSAGVMGREDPTASGVLGVSIAPDYYDSTAWSTRSLNIVCYIVPTEHSLAGTLVGLGDRPVPLAS